MRDEYESLKDEAEFEGEAVTWMRVLNQVPYEDRDLLIAAAQRLRYNARLLAALTDGMLGVRVRFHPAGHAAGIVADLAEAHGGDVPRVLAGDEWKGESSPDALLAARARVALDFCREFREDQVFDVPAVVFHYFTDNWRDPVDVLSLAALQGWARDTSTDQSLARTLYFAGLGPLPGPDREAPDG
jgi:hypothetical protein